MEKRKLSDLSLLEIVLLPFNALAALLDLIFCIPYLGRALKWIWNSVLTLLHFIVGLVEMILWQLGFRPQKKFRIGFLILDDEDGEPLTTAEKVLVGVTKAQAIFAKAHIQIVPAFPPPKRLAEGASEASEALRWSRVCPPNGAHHLRLVGCNFDAIKQDIGLPGTYFQYHTISSFFDSGFRRLTGYGAPVTVFVVKDLSGFGGCSLGWLSDYVTVKHSSQRATAHELGHACNLFHRHDRENLMHPNSGSLDDVQMTPWQIAMLRASRHATLF